VSVAAPWAEASRRRPYWGELCAAIGVEEASVGADVRRAGGRAPAMLRARWSEGAGAPHGSLAVAATVLWRRAWAVGVEAVLPTTARSPLPAAAAGGPRALLAEARRGVRVGARWQNRDGSVTLAGVVAPGVGRVQMGGTAALGSVGPVNVTGTILGTCQRAQTRTDVAVGLRYRDSGASLQLTRATASSPRGSPRGETVAWHLAVGCDTRLPWWGAGLHLRVLAPLIGGIPLLSHAAVKANLSLEPPF
jgi:hypothetical protein